MIPLILGSICDRSICDRAVDRACKIATRAHALTGEKRKPIRLGNGHGDLVSSPIDPNDAKADALKALLPNFLKRRAGDLNRIRDAVAAGDFDVIKTIGHNLRGNGTTYGFPELSTIGEAIEKSASARDVAAVLRDLEQLTAEVERIAASS